MAYIYLVVLGLFGAHRFYFKKNLSATLMLINGIVCIGALAGFIWMAGDDSIMALVEGSKAGVGAVKYGKDVLILNAVYTITSLIATVWLVYDLLHLSKWLKANENSTTGNSYTSSNSNFKSFKF